VLRAAFYFTVNADEALVFSPPVTLSHILIVGLPFLASAFPAKRLLLAALAILLFVNNGAFIIGDEVVILGAAPPATSLSPPAELRPELPGAVP
jgi:hypothetical protein